MVLPTTLPNAQLRVHDDDVSMCRTCGSGLTRCRAASRASTPVLWPRNSNHTTLCLATARVYAANFGQVGRYTNGAAGGLLRCIMGADRLGAESEVEPGPIMLDSAGADQGYKRVTDTLTNRIGAKRKPRRNGLPVSCAGLLNFCRQEIEAPDQRTTREATSRRGSYSLLLKSHGERIREVCSVSHTGRSRPCDTWRAVPTVVNTSVRRLIFCHCLVAFSAREHRRACRRGARFSCVQRHLFPEQSHLRTSEFEVNRMQETFHLRCRACGIT